MSHDEELREAVESALRAVSDARTEQNVFEAGLIEGVEVADGHATVRARMADFDPRTEREVTEAVLAAARDVSGVTGAHVEPAGPDAGDRVTIADVDAVVAVASTKGGVGKTTVAVNLACALAADRDVALFDADIFGPNAPEILGAEGPVMADDEDRPVPVDVDGMELMSVGLMTEGGPLAWRGAMAHDALSDLFADTAWDDPDVLVVDLPPGTSDVALTTLQEVPVDGVVFVTTPFHTSVADTRRSRRLFEENGVPVLGTVVNMDGFVCEACGHDHDLFPDGRSLADFDVPVLASLPFDPALQSPPRPGSVPAAFADLAGTVTERLDDVERIEVPADPVDIRGLGPQERIDAVRQAFESLDAGEEFYLRSDRDPTPVGEFLVELVGAEGDPAEVLPTFAVERRGLDEWVLETAHP